MGGAFYIMKNNKRKAISKRLRYEVFARDRFACKYCGVSSEEAVLHIDHIQPICQGGTNDIENLITSCASCNLGKGGKTPTQAAPTEEHRLMLAQERKEQISAFEDAKAAIAARQGILDLLVDYWCSVTGRSDVDNRTIQTVNKYREYNDFDTILKWIDKAYTATDGKDQSMGRYISGIARNVLLEKQDDEKYEQWLENGKEAC